MRVDGGGWRKLMARTRREVEGVVAEREVCKQEAEKKGPFVWGALVAEDLTSMPTVRDAGCGTGAHRRLLAPTPGLLEGSSSPAATPCTLLSRTWRVIAHPTLPYGYSFESEK